MFPLKKSSEEISGLPKNYGGDINVAAVGYAHLATDACEGRQARRVRSWSCHLASGFVAPICCCYLAATIARRAAVALRRDEVQG